ncbi:MAG: Type II secretion system protein E [Parcubacteria group bacterium GW2011_GWA2_36_10]|nr:MAG: Type II secretion system protein E [Parcubacteria group bacterium GW2011_GWA2_36_10]
MEILSDTKIHDLIAKLGLVDQGVLDAALVTAREKGEDFVDFLIKQGLVKNEEVAQLIANNLHVRHVNLAKEQIKMDVLKILPEIVARKQQMLIFARDQEGLKVAMHNPFDYSMIKMLEKKTGDVIIPYFATIYDLKNAFGLYRKAVQQEYVSLIQKHAVAVQGSQVEDVSVVRLVDDLFSYGYTNHASDIHIEPTAENIMVRFRIDGVLHDVLTLPKSILELIVTRLKILAKLRTDETRSAQDGKIVWLIEGEKLDLRVSILPITHGEKVVMRLLSAKGQELDLVELGLKGRDLNLVQQAIDKPFGMILVTGPTGSGKTTTLYALIKIVNKRDVNICTIEDPVEYDLAGINQIQVNPKTNLTFAEGLRSLLRQDPDIIMVGEIRDEETADIAVNAAMTGHLVLSTLHTNDAATALPRLTDMKVEPFLVASTVNIIVAQRLVRKICLRCIASYTLSQQEIDDLKKLVEIDKYLDLDKLKDVRLYKGRGCDKCNNTGYAGRLGIFEVLAIEETMRSLIADRADSDKIRAQAQKLGMTTMMEDGFDKVVSGQTTLEEILRVTRQ